jgi:protein MpaA
MIHVVVAAVAALAQPAPPHALLLGRSVLGRPIQAVAVGQPRATRNVVVVGCIHGDEPAGIAIVRRLEQLRAPAHVRLWLVKTVNPDGLAADTRQNAHGVDLNRNFPSGWRRNGRPWSTYYSGPRPLSEREARITARLILRLRPVLTIWYHQHQDLVRATGRSVATARAYARLVRMRFRRLPSPPGGATKWQARRVRSGSAFVVELPAGSLSAAAVRRHARAVATLAAAAG